MLATRSSRCWVHSSALRRVVERVGNCLVEGERTAFAACGLVGFSTKGVARVLFAFLLKGNQIGQYGGRNSHQATESLRSRSQRHGATVLVLRVGDPCEGFKTCRTVARIVHELYEFKTSPQKLLCPVRFTVSPPANPGTPQ